MFDKIVTENLEILQEAILRVKKENIRCISGLSADLEELTERAFTYELYHQWKNLLRRKHSGLTINAEIKKVLNENNTFPDFVLHKSQDDVNLSNQILVCEVKRKSTSASLQFKDLKKLCEYLSVGYVSYSFACGVLLIVGEGSANNKVKVLSTLVKRNIVKWNKTEKENMSHPLVKDNCSNVLDRLYFIYYDPYQRIKKKRIKMQTLNELIKDQ